MFVDTDRSCKGNTGGKKQAVNYKFCMIAFKESETVCKILYYVSIILGYIHM